MYYEYDLAVNSAGAFTGATAGWLSFGGFTDSFLDQLETAGTQYGVYAGGVTSGTGTQNEDCRITNCVLDNCSLNAILITGGNAATQVLISSCYINPGANAATGITITGTGGLVSIMNNQIVAAVSGCTGLNVQSGTTGVTSIGNIITDFTYGVIL